MRKNINRLISIVIITMISILFISCESKTKDNKDGKTDFLKEVSPITLTFYFPTFKDGRAEIPTTDMLERISDKLENELKSTFNVELDFKVLDGMSTPYDEQISALLRSGSTCDAIVSLDLNLLVQEDLILDITQIFPEYAPQYFKKFDEYGLLPVTYSGKIMAIPAYMPASERVCAVIRADLADKYSITKIDDLVDYENFLKNIKENEPETVPVDTSPMNYNVYMQESELVNLFGYFVYRRSDPNMTLIPFEQTEEFKTAISTMNRWRNDGYTYSGYSYASTLIPIYQVNQWKDTVGTQEQYNIFPLNTNNSANRRNIGLPIAISKSSKHPELVIQIIEWLHSSQKNYDIIRYGIEGYNYVLNDERVDYSVHGGLYRKWFALNAFDNLDLMRESVHDSIDFKDKYREGLNKSSFAPHMGFRIVLSKQDQEIINERNRLLDKFLIKSTKEDTEKEINDFVSELQSRMQDVLKNIQSQLDDWRNAG